MRVLLDRIDKSHGKACPKLSAAIRRARLEKRITQDALARNLRIDPFTIDEWGTSQRPVGINDFWRLNAALDLTQLKLETRWTHGHGLVVYMLADSYRARRDGLTRRVTLPR